MTFKFSLPPRRLKSPPVLHDLQGLMEHWDFPPGAEVLLGLCDSGRRELAAIGASRVRDFLLRTCGLPMSAKIHLLSHEELRSDQR